MTLLDRLAEMRAAIGVAVMQQDSEHRQTTIAVESDDLATLDEAIAELRALREKAEPYGYMVVERATGLHVRFRSARKDAEHIAGDRYTVVPLYERAFHSSSGGEDSARLDWLENEYEREQIAMVARAPLPHSLFRRNTVITRAAIDAAMNADASRSPESDSAQGGA